MRASFRGRGNDRRTFKARARKDTRTRKGRKQDRSGYVRPHKGKRAPSHHNSGVKANDWFLQGWVTGCAARGANPVPRAQAAADRLFADFSIAQFCLRYMQDRQDPRCSGFLACLAELFIDANRESDLGKFLLHSRNTPGSACGEYEDLAIHEPSLARLWPAPRQRLGSALGLAAAASEG